MLEPTTSSLAQEPESLALQRLADGRWRIGAPAKLNLGLRIFPRRPDGFHDLESWFVPISWHDTLWVTPDRPLELIITGRTEGIPTDPATNLVGRAALALAQSAGIEPRARIELHKVVPPGGGLGGGSSDAASTLLALNAAWGLGYTAGQLAGIAEQLGSDVPFFISGVPALCTGRGEKITPLPPRHPLFAVLFVSPEGLATKPVYESFDASAQDGNLCSIDWRRYAVAPARQLNEMLTNDLEPAAFAIAVWLQQLQEYATRVAGRHVHMTGSGSTLFTLCESSREATDIERMLRAELPGNTMCVPVRIIRQR